jgi:hypothetical protein
MSETTISNADLDAAVRALEAEGIPTTHQAVLDWVAQHRPAQSGPVPAEQRPSTDQNRSEDPSSPQKGVSRLARFAVPPAEGQSRRKPGRPLTVASWFPAVAKTMADGTTLRTARSWKCRLGIESATCVISGGINLGPRSRVPCSCEARRSRSQLAKSHEDTSWRCKAQSKENAVSRNQRRSSPLSPSLRLSLG